LDAIQVLEVAGIGFTVAGIRRKRFKETIKVRYSHDIWRKSVNLPPARSLVDGGIPNSSHFDTPRGEEDFIPIAHLFLKRFET
jgi:hypothetical protein